MHTRGPVALTLLLVQIRHAVTKKGVLEKHARSNPIAIRARANGNGFPYTYVRTYAGTYVRVCAHAASMAAACSTCGVSLAALTLRGRAIHSGRCATRIAQLSDTDSTLSASDDEERDARNAGLDPPDDDNGDVNDDAQAPVPYLPPEEDHGAGHLGPFRTQGDLNIAKVYVFLANPTVSMHC